MPQPRPGRRLALVGVVTLLTGLVFVASSTPSPPAQATSIVPFGIAFTANDNGSIAVFGNNLMVCPAGGDCAATRAGTTTKNNNSYNMVHLDVDGATFPTFSSSGASVVLPDGAEVRWAGLYWGARLGAGRGGVAATGDGRQMKLRAPGDAAYRTITAGRLFGPSGTADRAYQAFADVTAVVQAAGPGAYTGADVPAATGEDRHAGWSLVVVYRAPSLPLRNLTVFDGLADVGQNDPQSITISGFTTPVTGIVNARIGLVAYEGDRGSTGDRAVFNGTQLATTLSPGTNFFNGTNDDNGTLVTARTPADVNMLGFDIKNFDAPGILANNARSAQIDLASTSERYFPGVVTTAIDVFAPDFSPSTKTVTNLSGGDPARVGDRLRYDVTFVNGGQDPAINTSIFDPIPPGTTYVPGSLDVPTGVTGSFDSAANGVRVLPGSFPVGRSMTFTFDVDVGASAADTEVANRATITYDGATVAELQDLTFSTAAAAIAVVASADLVVTKVNTPEPVVAGQALTSTITVRNGGPSPATDVVLEDELPPGVGAVTATPTQGSCTVAADAVTCPIGTMAAGAVVTVTVQTAVPPGSTAASLTDVARVTSPTADPDPDDNTTAATTEVVRDADLSVVKSTSSTTVTPGLQVVYTITATNNGPSTALLVAIDDPIEDPDLNVIGATLNVPGPCSFDPNNARCTALALAPGASAVMTVTALLDPDATPGESIANEAAVSSPIPDSDPSDNNDGALIVVGPPVSELTIAKTASAPTPLIAGLGEVRYTIDVGNDGPSDADPVTVSDVLPAGFVAGSASSDRGECTITPAPTGDTVTCVVGALVAPFGGAGGARATITIVAGVPADLAPGSYENAATVSAPSSPPTTSPTALVTVEAQAAVSITKSFPPGSDPDITPGTTETYRIRVVNDGPSVASDVVVTDTLPPGLTATAWRVASVTPPGPAPVCDVDTLSCGLGDLPPGTTVELELDVSVDGGLDPDAPVVNTAIATTPTPDPNPGDNTSIFTVSSEPQADLSIRKFPLGSSPIAGDEDDGSLADRSFRVEIANFGPSSASGIAFTDTFPAGMTFERIYDEETGTDLTPFLDCDITGAPETGQTVSCTLPFELPAFVGVFFAIEFTVDPTVPDGSVLQNDITVESDVPDGNAGNNASTATVSVRAVANLRTIKRVFTIDPVTFETVELPDPQVAQLPPGYPVQFILDVVNDGPSAARDVTLVDTFEAESGPPQILEGSCEVLTGELACRYVNAATGDVLPPYDGTLATLFRVTVIQVPLSDTPQGVYTNTAVAASSTEDPTPADNTDTRDVEVIEPVADLIIEKLALTDPLVAGETFSYDIQVQAGAFDAAVPRFSSDAADVVVTDTLPPGLVPASATSTQGSCTVSGQDVTCELGTITALSGPEPVAPNVITISGTVAPDIAGETVENTAVATTSTDLIGGGGSVEATVSTPVERSGDLAVTKVADSATATAGGGITFTVTVTNTGPSDATDVVLTDLLPAPFEFSSDGSDDECAPGPGGVVCTLGTVAAGTSRALTIGATLPSGAAPGSVTNTASVTSDVDDPDPSDDSASVDVAVVRAADLAVTKAAAAEGVLLGGTIAYTLTVVNEGPSDTTGVVLTESIPTGTIVDTLPPGCSGTGPVTCAIGDLAAGETVSLELVLEVPDTLAPGPLPNTASVTSAIPDPDPSDNSADTIVEAVAQADVTLTKTIVTADPIAGRPVAFLLTVVNNGPTVAPNASLSDPIPTGSTFVSFVPSQGTCQLDEVEDVAAASCNLGRMEVGATATAILTVTTDPGATTITNTGFAGSGGLDEVPEDNEATVTTPLRRVADLSVTKTGPASLPSGGAASYIIEYGNAGPSTAVDVVVTDTLSAGLVPRPSPGCTVTGTTISCPVGVVAPGASGSITVTADVDPSLPLGTVLADVASITSSAADPDPDDNTAEVSSTVDALNDIGVDVTAEQDEVRPGDTASFSVVVRNNGTQVAEDVTLVNDLPPAILPQAVAGGPGSARAIAIPLPAGCTASASRATCVLGDIAVGQTLTLRFGGTVAAGTPAGTVLSDTATVSVSGIDTVVGNNVDADTIIVVVIVVVPGATTTTTVPRGGGGGGSGGGGGGGRLPIVGTDPEATLAVASIVLGLGALAVATARRRRQT